MGRLLRLQWKKGKSKKGTSIDQLERKSWRQAVGAEGDVTWKLQEKEMGVVKPGTGQGQARAHSGKRAEE